MIHRLLNINISIIKSVTHTLMYGTLQLQLKISSDPVYRIREKNIHNIVTANCYAAEQLSCRGSAVMPGPRFYQHILDLINILPDVFGGVRD